MAESEKIREQANRYFELAKANCKNDSLRIALNEMALMLREKQKNLEYAEYRKCKSKHTNIEFIEYCLGHEIYKCMECGKIIHKKIDRSYSDEF